MPRVYAYLVQSSVPHWAYIKCQGDGGDASQTADHPIKRICDWTADVATDFTRAFRTVVMRDATHEEIADIKAAATHQADAPYPPAGAPKPPKASHQPAKNPA